jgi:hypothetical protein
MRNSMRLGIAFAMMLVPAVCPAQQAARWRDSVTRLNLAANALHDSLLQFDSAAVEIARHGDLVVSASSDQAAKAVAILDRFSAVRDRWFGGATPVPGGFRILVSINTSSRSNTRGTPDAAGVVIISGLPDNGSAEREHVASGQVTAANAMIDRYGYMMITSVPALFAWMENPPPLSIDEQDRHDQAMYAFVTATGPVQRRCVDGGLKACAVAMNIVPTGDTIRGGTWSPFMRADLMYFALDLGGADSWTRLHAAADSGVAAALAAAARMPVDSVLARWRADLLSRRPVASIITPGTAIVAITWATALMLGALGASRWT